MENIQKELKYEATQEEEKAFEGGINNLQDHKKNYPEIEHIDYHNFLNFTPLMDNVLCGLLKDTIVLFCFRQMSAKEDALPDNLPETTINPMNNIASIQDDNFLLSMPTIKNYPKSFPAVANIMDRISKHQLSNRIVENYFLQLPPGEVEYIQCLLRFKRTCQQMVRGYCRTDNNLGKLKSDSFEYQQPVKDIQNEYKSFTDACTMHEHRFYEETMKEKETQKQMLQNNHSIKLHDDRQKYIRLFAKNSTALNEDQNLRNEALLEKKRFYETALMENLRKCRQYQETRYKREAAVIQIIEKFDRDVSGEHAKLEKLSQKYSQLSEKFRQLDEMLRIYTMENILVIALGEREKAMGKWHQNIGAIIKIQKWWRNRLNKMHSVTVSTNQSPQSKKLSKKKKPSKNRKS